MAVTQQFARISEVEVVERILSFEAGRPDDYLDLDLDWAGRPLLRVCEHLNLGWDASAVVKRALEGETPIGSSDYGPVMALGPAAVVEVARGFAAVDEATFAIALAASRADVRALMSERFDGDSGLYLTGHFNALRDFYQGAAQRELAVAVWWD